jgi:hypothetical protein
MTLRQQVVQVTGDAEHPDQEAALVDTGAECQVTFPALSNPPFKLAHKMDTVFITELRIRGCR